MSKAGAEAEVRERISGESASAQAEYRAAMLPAARKPDAQRIASAVRLSSGWVSLRGFTGPEINVPRYVNT